MGARQRQSLCVRTTRELGFPPFFGPTGRHCPPIVRQGGPNIVLPLAAEVAITVDTTSF
jgi:hypothetical protein